MNAIILLVSSEHVEIDHASGYVTGGIIALLILGYLIYSLFRPEKF